MSKWATIDQDKLEREIDQRAAAIDAIGGGTGRTIKGFDKIIELTRMMAEHDALVTVFNCISRADAPAQNRTEGET